MSGLTASVTTLALGDIKRSMTMPKDKFELGKNLYLTMQDMTGWVRRDWHLLEEVEQKIWDSVAKTFLKENSR